MRSSTSHPFSSTALLGWFALSFSPALVIYLLIRGGMAVIYFPLIPLASVAMWLLTLPFASMTHRFREWAAGGPLGMVWAIMLASFVMGGI